MIRAFFVDFLLPLLLFLLVRSILKSVFGAARTFSRQMQPQQPSAPTVQPGGELRKDPVCGTYVSTAISMSRNVNGQVVYFCSKQCADRYKG
jgi:YHS domain-containing protein